MKSAIFWHFTAVVCRRPSINRVSGGGGAGLGRCAYLIGAPLLWPATEYGPATMAIGVRGHSFCSPRVALVYVKIILAGSTPDAKKRSGVSASFIEAISTATFPCANADFTDWPAAIAA
jgi:hypothetical protein